MQNRRRFIACALGATLAFSACSSAGSMDAASAPSSGPSVGGDVSESHYYASLKDLAKESELVVVAEPTGKTRTTPADADNISGEMSTLSEMRITSILKGKKFVPGVGSTIEVRQLGTVKSAVVPEELVTSGNQYLLFLKRFEFEVGKPLDQWTGTSIDAFYVKKSSESEFANKSVHGIGQLDKKVTLQQVARELTP